MILRQFSSIRFLQDLHIFMQQKFHLIQSLYYLKQHQQHVCIDTCIKSLQNGQYLHQALIQFPQYFDAIIIMFVRMGELSGRLPDTLNCAIMYLKFKQDLTYKTKKHLFYPLMLLIVLCCVLYAFAYVIIPQMENQTMIDDTWYIKLSYFILNIFIILLTILIIFLCLRAVSPWLKNKTASWLFYLPLGSIYYRLQQGYFLKILAILLMQKVPPSWALMCLESAIPFPKIQKQYAKCASDLKEGKSLSKALQNLDCIQGYIIAVGSDHWIQYLDEVAQIQLQKAQEELSSVVRMIQPLAVLMTGAMIILLASSLFIPLYGQLAFMTV